MLFHLKFDSPISPHKQIVDQVTFLIASGALEVGSLLPSIRDLGHEILVNPNTVAKAYAELESQGVIESVAGKGCFLRTNRSLFKKEVRLELLTREIDSAVIQAHHLQVGKPEFLRVAEDRFDVFQRERDRAAKG